jgi:hypothetical protein
MLVTSVVMGERCTPIIETNYYGIINKIHDFSFARNKELKVVFFECDWFDSNTGTW